MNTFKNLLTEIPEWEDKGWVPEITPVSNIDLERNDPVNSASMFLHMSDPCPNCGAFNMLVGDWACYGQCSPCEVKQWGKY